MLISYFRPSNMHVAYPSCQVSIGTSGVVSDSRERYLRLAHSQSLRLHPLVHQSTVHHILRLLTHDMPLPEHLLSQIHELSYATLAISDELVELESNQGDTLRTIEDQASRQSLLRQLTQRSYQDLIL